MILFNKVNWNFLIRTPFVYKLKGRFILLNRPFLDCRQTITLISSPGTRFPRAVQGPPRRLCACGVSPGLAFPAGVSNIRSNQLVLTFRYNPFA